MPWVPISIAAATRSARVTRNGARADSVGTDKESSLQVALCEFGQSNHCIVGIAVVKGYENRDFGPYIHHHYAFEQRRKCLPIQPVAGTGLISAIGRRANPMHAQYEYSRVGALPRSSLLISPEIYRNKRLHRSRQRDATSKSLKRCMFVRQVWANNAALLDIPGR
jgi:hypothetical protein